MTTIPIIRALIVDESASLRRDVRQAISKTGVAGIYDYESGKEAISILPAIHPAIVIVGRQLEDMTGFEFSKSLRSSRQLASVPIMMLSPEGDLEDLMQAVDNGIDSYVVVPFRPQDLADKVAAVVRRLAEELRSSPGVTLAIPDPSPLTRPKGFKHESVIDRDERRR